MISEGPFETCDICGRVSCATPLGTKNIECYRLGYEKLRARAEDAETKLRLWGCVSERDYPLLTRLADMDTLLKAESKTALRERKRAEAAEAAMEYSRDAMASVVASENVAVSRSNDLVKAIKDKNIYITELEYKIDQLQRIVDNHTKQCGDFVHQRNAAWERLKEWKRKCDLLEETLKDMQGSLHRFQNHEEIESDYLCRSDLELLAANGRIAVLEDALNKYGHHINPECMVQDDKGRVVCICGLQSIRQEVPCHDCNGKGHHHYKGGGTGPCLDCLGRGTEGALDELTAIAQDQGFYK